jgi:hypothetical protein
MSVLIALDVHILFDWVMESNPLRSLAVCHEISVISLECSDLPLSVMIDSHGLIFSSPVVEWGVEDTVIGFAEVRLSLEFWSPQVTLGRPWSTVDIIAPRVPHLDKSGMD